MPGSVTAACCSCGPIPARRRRWCSTPTTGHSPCSRAPASAASHAAPRAHRRLCPLRQPQENHLMERTQLFDLMGELKLFGMKAAFDEIMATAVKRQHEPQRIVGDLLNAEISEKQARSIKYQLTIAKLPLAKDLDDFQFAGTPINETLVNDLAGGGFIAQPRNAVLVGGTGTGKTHLAIAIARSCIRGGARGRFYNVVDLVNRLETQTRAGRPGAAAPPHPPPPVFLSSPSTNLAICRSLNPAGNSYSISSAGSTSAPQSSSPRTSPSGSGRASSVSRRFHDASFLERLVCRTRARSRLICSSDTNPHND